MNATANSGIYTAQERTALYTDRSRTADRTKIADQNRANAEAADRAQLQKDRITVRSNGAIEISPLDSLNLQSILEKLTLDIFGNEKGALAAQGNLDSKAVLALLED